MNYPSREFDEAIDAACHGIATERQLSELAGLLHADPQAMDEYLIRVALHDRLESLGPLAPAVAPAARSASVLGQFRRHRRWVVATAACVGLAGLFVGISDPWAVAPASVVSSAGSEFRPGDRLSARLYELKQGAVELVTPTGARVAIEAPAEFVFDSPQRLRMFRGRASAEAPPSAKGFTIVTPAGSAVDLGTRFGVDIDADGAEIHVFQGEVAAQPAGGPTRTSLRDGEALTLRTGSSQARGLRSAAFLRSDEIRSLSAGLAAGQQSRARLAAGQLRSDPSVIALLDFETGSPPQGVFRTVQGRWPGSKAAEFNHVGDHITLDAGGDRTFPQLSLAAWVRLDRLDSTYQSLYHTDGWYEGPPGQVHWMINRDTTMRLALRGNALAPEDAVRSDFPDSRTSVLPERGRWVHLAVVYDADARTVRFYRNGEFDNEVRLSVAHPAVCGPAQIGNWNRRDRKLSGRVDEIFLLARPLDDAEVRTLFEAGNPYR